MSSNPRDNSSINWLQILITFALAAGAAWVQLPLESNRPSNNNAGMHIERIQNTDMRLWQDPFSEIDNIKNVEEKCRKLSLNTSKTPGFKLELEMNDCPTSSNPPRDREWLASLVKSKNPEALTLMQVMVGGSSSIGEQERRRRTRYAVLSALYAQGYVPEDTEHIGYFKAEADKISCVSMPKNIAYEWFTSDKSNTKESLLLLWLDEDALIAPRFSYKGSGYLHQSTPTACMSKLSDQLLSNRSIDHLKNIVIGPATSTGLLAMKDEGCAKEDTKLSIYSPFATIYDVSADQCAIRQIPTDKELSKSLVDELRSRRDINLATQPHSKVALIGQWDTAYARGLKDNFTEQPWEGHTGNKHPDQVLAYSFMRGLDGRLPGKSEDQKNSNKGKSDQDKSDTDRIERPEGDAQTDYLRRIADDLKEQDQTTRKQCTLKESFHKHCGIRAIGIFANDYYDKLLVLKALKPKFPDAVFFTTDLEAGMMHPSDNEFTRNMVVASIFGLEPTDLKYDSTSPKAQFKAPLFRDAYQTSAFYSVLKALNPSLSSEKTVQLFEIGRTKAIHLNHPPINNNQVAIDYGEKVGMVLLIVLGMALLIVLGLVLLWYLFLRNLLFNVKKTLRDILGLLKRLNEIDKSKLAVFFIKFCIYLSLLLCIYAFVRVFCLGCMAWDAWLEISQGTEPFYWWEGVSIWPSEVLRSLSFILALYLIYRANKLIQLNQKEAHERFFAWADSVPPQSRPKLSSAWDIFKSQTKFIALIIKAFILAIILFSMTLGLMWLFGFPNTPSSSEISRKIDLFITIPTVIICFILVFYVAAYILLTTKFFAVLVRETDWPESIMTSFGLPARGETRFHDWVDLILITRITSDMENFVFYPIPPLILLLSARSQIFDAWSMPIALLMTMSFAFCIVLLQAWWLRKKAEEVRYEAIRWMERRLIKLENYPLSNSDKTKALKEQAKMILGQMKNLHEGAFAPLSEQPSIRGALAIIGTVSGLKLAEYFALFNL